MTPAIKAAEKANISHKVHQYEHDPAATSYGEEAAQKLGLKPERVFKTLLITPDDKLLAVAVLPVSTMLNLKSCAKALGFKKVAMANKLQVERTTGYVLGGVSPIAQKKRLPTVIDTSALAHATIFVSAGRRGLEIELTANDLQNLVAGHFAAIT